MASIFKNFTFRGGVKGVLDPFNVWHGGKGSAAKALYDFQPYSGTRPPQPNYLRPSEDLTWNTVSRRSQGQDVGFDPARKDALIALVKSELGKRQEDEIRSAKGSLSSAGLSGNPRAAEALTGRVNRDIGRTLGDELSKISIEDLTRANEERDANTQRLQNFSNQQFGQSNRVADFDLSVYNAEQGNRLDAFNTNEGVRRFDLGRSDDQFSDLTGAGLSLADLYLQSQTGIPGIASTAGQATGATSALRSSGTGIAPTSASQALNPYYSYGMKAPRRNITR